uniref:Uncharacterized protein n=1 Tax=Auxenochlorella protothecoides TaxID=3075 RepID=A0A1D1ZYS7_AUXPR
MDGPLRPWLQRPMRGPRLDGAITSQSQPLSQPDRDWGPVPTSTGLESASKPMPAPSSAAKYLRCMNHSYSQPTGGGPMSLMPQSQDMDHPGAIMGADTQEYSHQTRQGSQGLAAAVARALGNTSANLGLMDTGLSSSLSAQLNSLQEHVQRLEKDFQKANEQTCAAVEGLGALQEMGLDLQELVKGLREDMATVVDVVSRTAVSRTRDVGVQCCLTPLRRDAQIQTDDGPCTARCATSVAAGSQVGDWSGAVKAAPAVRALTEHWKEIAPSHPGGDQALDSGHLLSSSGGSSTNVARRVREKMERHRRRLLQTRKQRG